MKTAMKTAVKTAVNTAVSTLSAFIVICFALLSAGLAHAGNLIDVQVIGRSTGQTLTTYFQRGKLYVVGTPGERYSLRLTNRTGARVMGVLSVDGVNAVTGETASPDQAGYVLDPYQVAEITGWRKSQDEVARFYFTPLPDSYAARTDRPGNVGVIGLAAFREYVEPIAMAKPESYANQASRDAASAAAPAPERAKSAGSLAQREERLGTGHGEREFSSVTQTAFRRAGNSPDEVVAIWYDSRERLASRGVLPYRRPVYTEPTPFPQHYVPDPRS
jgi:hypothetical protein